MEDSEAPPSGKSPVIGNKSWNNVSYPQAKIREQQRMNGETVEEPKQNTKQDNMLMMRIIGPIISFVDRPWKVLFFLRCRIDAA